MRIIFFSFSFFFILTRIEIWRIYIHFLYIFTDDNGYWTYLGSLTTPPCNESVTWILFKKCIEVSHHQLNIFRNLRKFSRGEECPCHENHGAVSVYTILLHSKYNFILFILFSELDQEIKILFASLIRNVLVLKLNEIKWNFDSNLKDLLYTNIKYL